jgi:hypothetical protein
MKNFPQKLRPITPCQDSVKIMTGLQYQNLKTRTFQVVKMLANYSEYFEIIIYEVSSLKIFSQNFRQKLRSLCKEGSMEKFQGDFNFSKEIQWTPRGYRDSRLNTTYTS